jgi:signal transduction histidine kinase
MNSKPSHSFIGVPILLEKNKLEGVITITRPIKSNPYSQDDIDYVQAIAKTIAQIIEILELQEQRKKLYITLAHEINTYITPILADAENLQNELTNTPNISTMASHLFGQVQRLQLMTETILGVVSRKNTGEKLTVHSIYRPLIDAITMFREEAKALGCDILVPKVSETDRFPEIEMRLFELTLAFKNLIHNAIKYSFRPPADQNRNRYIRITGKWCNKEHTYYCVSIENYGVGITQEEISKRLIFKDFYRGMLSSDRQRTGSGIGLAYVSQVVEKMHHGSIEVESRPMGGNAHLTTFRITLPVRQPKSDRPEVKR